MLPKSSKIIRKRKSNLITDRFNPRVLLAWVQVESDEQPKVNPNQSINHTEPKTVPTFYRSAQTKTIQSKYNLSSRF